ncbi:MAG TPA: hypothetical protein VJJ98_01795 [Sedimentisphaerales bacterium]|nr:hypothetical protein [Sedimentisphaerales bacterium]
MKSNRKRYYTTIGLVWAACAILLFFVYLLVLRPQNEERRSMANQLANEIKAHDAAVKAQEHEAQDALRTQLQNLQTELKVFAIDSGESANLTFDISQLASQRQIEAFSIKSRDARSISDSSEFTHVGENYFDVGFVCGFSQFAGFLSALERHEPAMLVDEFAITRSEESEKGHHAKLNLAVLVVKK